VWGGGRTEDGVGAGVDGDLPEGEEEVVEDGLEGGDVHAGEGPRDLHHPLVVRARHPVGVEPPAGQVMGEHMEGDGRKSTCTVGGETNKFAVTTVSRQNRPSNLCLEGRRVLGKNVQCRYRGRDESGIGSTMMRGRGCCLIDGLHCRILQPMSRRGEGCAIPFPWRNMSAI